MPRHHHNTLREMEAAMVKRLDTPLEEREPVRPTHHQVRGGEKERAQYYGPRKPKKDKTKWIADLLTP